MDDVVKKSITNKNDMKRLSEIIGGVVAIVEMRVALENQLRIEKKLKEQKKFFDNLGEKDLLPKDKEHKAQYEEAVKNSLDVPASIIDEELKIMQSHVKNLVSNSTDELISPKYKKVLLLELGNKKSNLSEEVVKETLLKGYSDTQLKDIDNISANIDAANPSREVIKSFKTMSRAITEVVKKLEEVVDILEAYIQEREDKLSKTTETKTNEAKKPEAKTNETKKPETKTNEAKKPEAKTNETKKPEAKTNETKKPEAKTNEAKKPEAKTTEAKKNKKVEDLILPEVHEPTENFDTSMDMSGGM